MSAQFQGKVTITRWSGSSQGIRIELNDASSGVRVVEINLTVEAFGFAITGLGFQECRFEMGNTKVIGMKSEYKKVLIKTPAFDVENAARLNLVSAFEVDGWKAHLDDLGNHHNKVADGYMVGFYRFVKRETKTIKDQ